MPPILEKKHTDRYLELDKVQQKKIDSILEQLNGLSILNAKRLLSIAGRELENRMIVSG